MSAEDLIQTTKVKALGQTPWDAGSNPAWHSNFSCSNKIALEKNYYLFITKVVFAEFDLPKILVSDAGTNLVSEQFKDLCRCLNIDQVLTSSYHHQSNGQV